MKSVARQVRVHARRWGGIGQGRIGPIEMPVKFKPLDEVEKTIKKTTRAFIYFVNELMS